MEKVCENCGDLNFQCEEASDGEKEYYINGDYIVFDGVCPYCGDELE